MVSLLERHNSAEEFGRGGNLYLHVGTAGYPPRPCIVRGRCRDVIVRRDTIGDRRLVTAITDFDTGGS
jgi:hypothetical protein